MLWFRRSKTPRIKQLQFIKLQADDTLLITTEQRLTAEEAARIKQIAQAALGDRASIMVTGSDFEFKIIRHGQVIEPANV